VTAIKPVETRRVVAVAAETYPMNTQCAWPDCTEDAHDPHHAFPRSATGGDSYFVAITFDTYEDAIAVVGKGIKVTEVPGFGWVTDPIPHATGLCREHHNLVESRVAKITLEGGKWLAWEGNDGKDGNKGAGAAMTEVGELQPQPGARLASKKRKRFKGEKRRKRRTISIRVPNDEQEDGAGLLDEKFDSMRELLGEDETYPPYYVISAALDYTLLNADESDFEKAE
jgi:hypothetical protein